MAKKTVLRDGPGTVADEAKRRRLHRALDAVMDAKGVTRPDLELDSAKWKLERAEKSGDKEGVKTYKGMVRRLEREVAGSATDETTYHTLPPKKPRAPLLSILNKEDLAKMTAKGGSESHKAKDASKYTDDELKNRVGALLRASKDPARLRELKELRAELERRRAGGKAKDFRKSREDAYEYALKKTKGDAAKAEKFAALYESSATRLAPKVYEGRVQMLGKAKDDSEPLAVMAKKLSTDLAAAKAKGDGAKVARVEGLLWKLNLARGVGDAKAYERGAMVTNLETGELGRVQSIVGDVLTVRVGVNPNYRTDKWSRANTEPFGPYTEKAQFKGVAKDTTPFDRDTDAGAAKIVKSEAAAGKSAKEIAAKYGFSLSFVEESMPKQAKDKLRPV